MSIVMRVGVALLAAGLTAMLPGADGQLPKDTKTKNAKNAKAAAPAGPLNGVKTPGVLIPAANLKSEVEIPVEGPGWIAVTDAVMVESKAKDSLVRIDAKANKPLDPVGDLKKPCSGALVAFGSLWIPNCETQTVVREDPKTFKVSATLAIGSADVTMGLAATTDSLWMLTDSRTTLSRIDPTTNMVVGEMRLPAGCNDMLFTQASLWITCPADNQVYRINPENNLVLKHIEVSAEPRALVFGDNSIWVLCAKEGKIDRIDPKTDKVTKTIELNVPNAGGSIAYGDNYLWVSQKGFPITRIDTESEKVVQQFWGAGGGEIAAAPGAIWVSDAASGKVIRFDPKRILATLAE